MNELRFITIMIKKIHIHMVQSLIQAVHRLFVVKIGFKNIRKIYSTHQIGPKENQIKYSDSEIIRDFIPLNM